MLRARNEERARKGLKKARRRRWLPCRLPACLPGCQGRAPGTRGGPSLQLRGRWPGRKLAYSSVQPSEGGPAPPSPPRAQDAVVRREKVAVLTQGTLTDADMTKDAPEAAYLLALAELPVPGQ